MIETVDDGDRIKVFDIQTVTPDKTQRVYLASIKKRSFDIPEDLLAKLSKSDRDYLREVVKIYRKANEIKLQATALDLPTTLNLAIEYVSSQATEQEAELILQCVQNARRALRKMQDERKGGFAQAS